MVWHRSGAPGACVLVLAALCSSFTLVPAVPSGRGPAVHELLLPAPGAGNGQKSLPAPMMLGECVARAFPLLRSLELRGARMSGADLVRRIMAAGGAGLYS